MEDFECETFPSEFYKQPIAFTNYITLYIISYFCYLQKQVYIFLCNILPNYMPSILANLPQGFFVCQP